MATRKGWGEVLEEFIKIPQAPGWVLKGLGILTILLTLIMGLR